MKKTYSKFKRGLELIASFSILFLASQALAREGSVGNGGGAWVCRNTDASVRWVKLVDLFEAQNQYGLKLDSFAQLPVDQELPFIDAKVRSVNPDAIQLYENALATVKANLVFSAEAAIVRINDAQFIVEPAKELCLSGIIDYENLANYTDDGTIVVAQPLYDQLSPGEQAALYVHETIYKLYRDYYGCNHVG